MIHRAHPWTPSRRPVVTFLATWALAGACAARADDDAPGAVTPADAYRAVAEELREVIRREVAAKDLPGFAIALVDGDRVVWAEGFGFADSARRIPMTPRTICRVGSISKLLTDVAVMQLVERGELSLDAPITDALPDFAPRNPFGPPLTLRQLMSHRSGLVREPPVGHYFDPDEPTLAATVASLNGTSLVYEPGTRTKYSNAGIAVVGYALQQRVGGPFSEHMDQAVLAPLGMTASSFEATDAVRQALATGWMWTYDGRRFEAPPFAIGTGPAGNLYSNVLDLSKFVIAVFNDGEGEQGRILRPESLQQMLTPQQGPDGKPLPFGIGFAVSELDGHRRVGHGGAVYGFATQLEALPDRKLAVVAVAPLDAINGHVRRIADHALRLMLAQQDGRPLPELPSSGPVPPDLARRTAGLYAEGDEILDISELNGRLYLWRGEFLRELRAHPDGFVIDDGFGYGPEVRRIDGDRLAIGERHYARVADEAPDEAPPRWRGLIGEYGWDHNTLYILEDHGRLYALIEWFFRYPLTEVGEDEFAFPDYGLYHGERLKFTREGDGRAVRVVAAEVTFERRKVGAADGGTFRIEPVRPVDELRAEALAAEPPREEGRFLESNFVEPSVLDPTIRLDIRYATTNNFTGAVFYEQPRAFLQRPAAEALVRAHRRLRERGLGVLIHDAYRPWHVTRMFWDATPEELRRFVADPSRGSRHNRGCAVDLTLYDLETGEPVEMVAGYDEFSARSLPTYPGGTSRQRWHRDLLRRTMEAEGFAVYEYEWWHFDHQDWKLYRIHNETFEELTELGRDGQDP